VSTEPVLRCDDLGKDYGDGLGLVTLDLTVKPGELIMLVGPNGAGKSTFLGLASGLVEPSNGSAWINGFEIGTIEARASTSFLPDAPVLYEDLSVNEHIEYIARLHNTDDWESYADDLLDMFNLTHRADDLPSKFSRGLKQKSALILGLIRPFSLLLIDEPFVGLDTPGQETLTEVLGDIVEQGAAIICSTHQLDLVPKATRCVGLRDGEKSYDGPATAAKIRELVGA
jgi:ABC-type multidrug transport system ATPase subunit